MAFADHNALADCDPNHYPPAQCDGARGGAGHEAPPLLVTPSARVAPGTPVRATSSGCQPNTPVQLGLVRMTSPAAVVALASATTTADSNGNFSADTVIPGNMPNGTYVLFSQCRQAGGTSTIVSTSSFTIQAPPAASAVRPSGNVVSSSGTTAPGAGAAGSSTSDDATTATAPAAAAEVAASDLPESFTPPAGWVASPATKAAVTEAVNLRLAAMRAELPAETTAAPSSAATPTDLTPWYAGGAALSLLVVGAAGWRRRATVQTAPSNEVSA